MSSTRASTPFRPQAPAPEPEEDPAKIPWWAPVSRWERKWVVPNAAKLAPVLAKPIPYDAKLFKYTRVEERRRPSFKDDSGTPSVAGSVVEDAGPGDAADAIPPSEAPAVTNAADVVKEIGDDVKTDVEVDVEADAQNAGPGVEQLQLQERPGDDPDAMDQLESTQSIVEENIEMLADTSEIVTAMDVDEALSHPYAMAGPADDRLKLHQKSLTSPTAPSDPAP
ncbi:hypothetical protein HKX48_008830 [Thoreauomyces humboldtii]|nr:hypothetical protein HKX48_008830 [Thoreauomyces humboldtii]